jgi:hypothetical protein
MGGLIASYAIIYNLAMYFEGNSLSDPAGAGMPR